MIKTDTRAFGVALVRMLLLAVGIVTMLYIGEVILA